MPNNVKIAIDAMGGENSPKKIIEGIEISANAESPDGVEGLQAFNEKRKPKFNE